MLNTMLTQGPQEPVLIRAGDAARVLGVGRHAFRKLVEVGKLRSVERVKGYYHREDVRKLAAEARHAGA